MDNPEVVGRSRMGKLKNKIGKSYDYLKTKVKTSYETYGFWRWIGIFFVGLLIGVAVGLALAGILYGIRANEPDNKMTFQQAVEKTILSGIYFGMTCSLLYVLAKKYDYNLELLILSAILLAGILASIGTSIPWQSLISIGIILIYPPFKLLCQVINQWIQKKRNNASKVGVSNNESITVPLLPENAEEVQEEL
jgi:hypothetical protein